MSGNGERIPAIVHCPLCGGPVHDEQDGPLRCAIGHQVTAEELAAATERRLAEAMWNAIEALDSEAMVLRLLEPTAHSESLAREAERQAAMLLDFATRHIRTE